MTNRGVFHGGHDKEVCWWSLHKQRTYSTSALAKSRKELGASNKYVKISSPDTDISAPFSSPLLSYLHCASPVCLQLSLLCDILQICQNVPLLSECRWIYFQAYLASSISEDPAGARVWARARAPPSHQLFIIPHLLLDFLPLPSTWLANLCWAWLHL